MHPEFHPPLVYIAGPYTQGDVAANVAAAMAAAHQLLDWGAIPVCPHLSHFLHIQRQRPYSDWINMDKELLRQSNVRAVWRLDGDSIGADGEVAFALSRLGVPVFRSHGSMAGFLGQRP